MKMELYMFFLTLTAVLSIESKIHKSYHLIGCSDTEKEDMYGLDGEEVYYYNFNTNKTVVVLPEFVDSERFVFSEYFEIGIHNSQICKEYLAIGTKAYKNQAEQMDPPQTSIYSRNDVVLGVENTLICHVTGFFPPTVRVSWTKNYVIVTENVTLSQYRPNNDGTYNLFSTLKIIPLEGEIYSCNVDHKALQQPQTKIWDVEVVLPGIGPSVFCGVGLTLGLLGMATGAYFYNKAQTGRSNMDTNINLDTISE
ncbi:H-2 class II histocompatibility antigen, A-U alpha chain-like [Rhinichthys klamathensis goyatoka]|uniref:H-2 class II histocompatibility antigen, A-U alpha chain-like n=1 Tax=Rhinichthys klamathensis goyatoka TaxID=3034132 RepID=UPI0024B4ABE0|nr:H-2 class II histocompatibility antigen, A-U alpha chain-like [Rhinichthys klamathensis goyatoka]